MWTILAQRKGGVWRVEAWSPGEKDTCTPGETENEGKSGVANIVSGSRAWLGQHWVEEREKDGSERFYWEGNRKKPTIFIDGEIQWGSIHMARAFGVYENKTKQKNT